MNMPVSKDDVFYQALKQAILELFPEYTCKITSKRECAKLYLFLMDTQRLTKNDHIMKIVAERFNALSPGLKLTNMSAAQYFCKKFKLYATEVDEKPHVSEKSTLPYDKSIQMVLDFLSDYFY